MGFFGTYRFHDRQWQEIDPDRGFQLAGPWLVVSIHDSDFTSVVYHPKGSGTGLAYLGFTPRSYFEDEQASDPTEVDSEATGLAQWWADLRGGATSLQMDAKAEELIGFLAEDLASAELEEEWDEDGDEELDDEDVFVEVKTVRFLAALELDPPAALVDLDH